MIIALAGKGGTGKTTICALFVKFLKELKKQPILVIDADPNANLNELLGVKVEKTIGQIREEMLHDKGERIAGMSKEEMFEYKINEVLIEENGFDLIVMGRPEGPGCYCYVNHLLRRYLEILSRQYKFIIIDNEAGLEHLSRRTASNIDILLIISEAYPRSIRTINRIKELVKELNLKIKKSYVILNKVTDEESIEIIRETFKEEVLGYIPEDPEISKFDMEGKSFFNLPSTSVAYKKAKLIFSKIIN